MQLTWAEAKRLGNLQKHGADFADAGRFDWAGALVWEDRRRDYGEARYIALGLLRARLHSLAFTYRDGAVHVIFARQTRAKGCGIGMPKRIRRVDPDNPEWTDKMLAEARPMAEVLPEIAANPPKIGRPRAAAPLKVIAVRIADADAETFRAQGKGWQKLARAALEREAKRLRHKEARPKRRASR